MEAVPLPVAPARWEQYISSHVRSITFSTGTHSITQTSKTIPSFDTSDLIDDVYSPANPQDAPNIGRFLLNLADVHIINGYNNQAAEAQVDIIRGYRLAIMKTAANGSNYDALVDAIDVARLAAMRASSEAITDSTDNGIHYIYTLPESVQARAAEIFVAGSRLVEQTIGVLATAINGTTQNISELAKSDFTSLDDAVQMIETAVTYAVRGTEFIDG